MTGSRGEASGSGEVLVAAAFPRRLAYFVHDLADAAVARRVRMLHAAGVEVTVLGFLRRPGAVPDIDGAPAIELGLTGDGRLVQRVWAVVKASLDFARVRAAVRGSDAVMARNLEVLVLAVRARGQRRLIYECLDIHRMLLSGGLAARCVQRIEQRLLQIVDLIVTSSPRFAEDYFRQRRHVTAPILLVENKVLAIDGEDIACAADPVAAGAPWIIGWFGMLRCRRSFDLLAKLAASSAGTIRVVLAGVPSEREFPDFAAQVAAVEGMSYAGRYTPGDLARLYGDVHFAWAIDYFEEGLNSAWLLPNRLYEALSYGAVPIALASVETGGWLARHDVGIRIDDATASLAPHLSALTAADYTAYRDRVRTVPAELLQTRRAECIALADAIFSGPAD